MKKKHTINDLLERIEALEKNNICKLPHYPTCPPNYMPQQNDGSYICRYCGGRYWGLHYCNHVKGSGLINGILDA